MVGIYKITNKVNGKSYVGQSTRIERRWNDEKRAAFNPKAHEYEYPLSRAFRKYGVENFTFEVIEECSQSCLNERERYWIHFYNSYYNGYNQTFGGDNYTSIKKKETALGIINDLKTTTMFHREIAERWDVSVELVQGINTGRYWFSEYEDYPLQKQRDITPKIWYCIECGKKISKGSERCMDCYTRLTRKVERPSKEELQQHLMELKGNFTQAGKDYGVTDNSVRKWCDAYNLPRASSAYKPVKKPVISRGLILPKQVAQIDLKSNEIIATYKTISEAAKVIGKANGTGHISAVCKGNRKTAYGFGWKYISE